MLVESMCTDIKAFDPRGVRWFGDGIHISVRICNRIIHRESKATLPKLSRELAGTVVTMIIYLSDRLEDS